MGDALTELIAVIEPFLDRKKMFAAAFYCWNRPLQRTGNPTPDFLAGHAAAQGFFDSCLTAQSVKEAR